MQRIPVCKPMKETDAVKQTVRCTTNSHREKNHPAFQATACARRKMLSISIWNKESKESLGHEPAGNSRRAKKKKNLSLI